MSFLRLQLHVPEVLRLAHSGCGTKGQFSFALGQAKFAIGQQRPEAEPAVLVCINSLRQMRRTIGRAAKAANAVSSPFVEKSSTSWRSVRWVEQRPAASLWMCRRTRASWGVAVSDSEGGISNPSSNQPIFGLSIK
jgi:hypothetical protein